MRDTGQRFTGGIPACHDVRRFERKSHETKLSKGLFSVKRCAVGQHEYLFSGSAQRRDTIAAGRAFVQAHRFRQACVRL